MDEAPPGDEFQISQEEIERIAFESIDGTLTGQVYDEVMVSHWINQINELVVEKLVELEKPFKYIVNTFIMQRNGAGVYTASSCFWDAANDGAVIYTWPKDKQAKDAHVKNTMQAVVSIYTISMISI